MKHVAVLILAMFLPCSLAVAGSIHESFVKAYYRGDVAGMLRYVIPPEPFFTKVVKYEAASGNVSEKKIRDDIKKFSKAQEEIFECLITYFPIKSYKELNYMPSVVGYQRVFFSHVLEQDERFNFQDELRCRKHLFEVYSKAGDKCYLLMEVCMAGSEKCSWVDRFALFAKRGDPGLLNCIMKTIQEIAPKK